MKLKITHFFYQYTVTDIKNTVKAMLLIIAAFVLCISMASCFTTKKHITSQQSKFDSSNVSNSHKEGIFTSDSTGIKVKDSAYSNTIQVNFLDTDTTPLTLITSEDPIQKAIDLVGPDSITVAGIHIAAKRKIKSLLINISGKTSTYDFSQLIKKDSGQVNEQNKTVVHKEEKQKDKEVERTTGFPWWILIAVGCAFVYLRIANHNSWFPFGWLKDEEDQLKQKS